MRKNLIQEENATFGSLAKPIKSGFSIEDCESGKTYCVFIVNVRGAYEKLVRARRVAPGLWVAALNWAIELNYHWQ